MAINRNNCDPLCNECNKAFIPRQSGQVYCGNACGAKGERKAIATQNEANYQKQRNVDYDYIHEHGRFERLAKQARLVEAQVAAKERADMGASIPAGPNVAGAIAPGLGTLGQGLVGADVPALGSQQQSAVKSPLLQILLGPVTGQQIQEARAQAAAAGLTQASQTAQAQQALLDIFAQGPGQITKRRTGEHVTHTSMKKKVVISPRQPRERKIILED